MFAITARTPLAVAISALCLCGIAATVQPVAAHAGTNDDSIMPVLSTQLAVSAPAVGSFRSFGLVAPVAGVPDDSI